MKKQRTDNKKSELMVLLKIARSFNVVNIRLKIKSGPSFDLYGPISGHWISYL